MSTAPAAAAPPAPPASAPRVLILHNRYRLAGGEERAVDLHAGALERAGIQHRVIVRDSAEAGRAGAAAAMLRGGEDPAGVAAAVRELGATAVHCHNMQPLLGPRALRAAREAGARVVLHLHNFRLFCAIGVAFRDGAPCFRCRGRLTLPGLVLNCRGSVPEAIVYAAGIARRQHEVFEAVDRFVAPSAYAAGQLTRLGVPAERIEVLPHYLPAGALAGSSAADAGEYALAAGRLSAEKGLETAIDASARTRIPLRIAGAGPLDADLRARARSLSAPVTFLGRVGDAELREQMRGAAMFLAPTRGSESFGLAALEAMGTGVPVVAARAGGLPELVGEERCVPRDDPLALAEAMGALWEDPPLRRSAGEALIARAREEFGEARYVEGLLRLYGA